ncbi:Chemotaxis regulator - transmits chemoreceptor signals to flagelllar motor components CheY [Paramagnetospirillum magnetotacticum MS-1]|uniref:Chemotaxis regulator-transmits chemoreceptor signals to flagelllar motor components CheY n=1 Tax=Paramagnetospirillum magnetotacticum MS-1 TaxID=272627 RepID=A0A0C2YVM3_PARME|nr:bacteriohemerythrin [Paramagnetospirillum magnetotacticum]KIL99148.1 Chemotaxis regulator - transmits chemoreceptor signals to flagelllar motor components CheY [Paramagnetospirillum magnetotacticum MS-1]
MLELTDDLRIGHPVIDADHQRLIEIINEFLEHSNEVNPQILHETLKSLLAYGREHFAREEGIQRQCLYPYQQGHSNEHKSLLDQVREIARAYFVAKTKPLNATSVQDVNELLKAWLIGHVKKFDTSMRDWVAPSLDMDAPRIKLASPDLAALIISPNERSRARLADLLSELGASKVLQAEDSITGLGMAFGDPVPDFIFCDLETEPLDGGAFAGALRGSNKAYITRIPLLLLHDAEDAEAIQNAMAAGASGVYPKSFNPTNLGRLLNQLLLR